MSDVEFTNEEILSLHQTLEASGRYSMPVRPALKVAAVTRNLEGPVKDIRKVDEKLRKKHARKEDGQCIFKTDDEGNRKDEFEIDDPLALQDDRNEMYDTQVTLDLPLFTQKDFEAIFKEKGTGEDKSERELPPIVLKPFVMLAAEDVNLDDVFGD